MSGNLLLHHTVGQCESNAVFQRNVMNGFVCPIYGQMRCFFEKQPPIFFSGKGCHNFFNNHCKQLVAMAISLKLFRFSKKALRKIKINEVGFITWRILGYTT